MNQFVLLTALAISLAWHPMCAQTNQAISPFIDSMVQQAYRFHGTEQYLQSAETFKIVADTLVHEKSWVKAAGQYLNSATVYKIMGRRDSFPPLAQLALRTLQQSDTVDYALMGDIHFRMYAYYSRFIDHQKMRIHADLARKAFAQLPSPLSPDYYLYLAEMATDLEEDETAILYCDSAITQAPFLPEPEQATFHFSALELQNRVYNRKGQHTLLLTNTEKMEQIARESGWKERLEYLPAIKAIAYEFMGDWERALHYYKSSTPLRSIDANISRVYAKMERMDSAEKYIDLALLPNRQDPFYEEPGFQGELFWQAGLLFARMDKYDLSQFYFQQASSWSERHGYIVTHAQTLHDWASSLVKEKRFIEGKAKIQEAFILFKQTESRDNQFIASSYEILGNIYRQETQWDSAFLSFHKGIQTMSLIPISMNDLPLADEVLYPKEYLSILSSLAESRLAREEDQDLFLGLEACNRSLDVLALVRQNIRRMSAKESWAEKSAEVCELGLHIAYRLFLQTGDPTFAEQAYVFAEKGKSILLQENFQRGQAIQYAGLPDSLLQQEQSLKSELAYYWQQFHEEQLSDQPDFSTLAIFREKLAFYTEAYSQLEDHLERSYPDYHQLLYRRDILSVVSLHQKLAHSHGSMIEYFWGEKYAYAIGINSTGIFFTQLDSANQFRQTLSAFLESLHTQQYTLPQSFLQQSSDLYKWILAPILQQLGEIERLIIVPDGPLGYLPFEVLVAEIGETRQRYLIEDFPISYANSASLLFQEASFSNSQFPFVGFGPTYEGLLTLPYVKSEIQELNDIMEGKILLGEQATETAFQQFVQKANVLHLAMHGFPNSDHPMQSYLLFSESLEGNKDGKLYTYELYNMNLPVELAVISACHTGYGPIARGEGIRSMARGFQYAGCPSVVMSLWEVNGVVAKTFMPLFYRYLKEGLPKDVALQQAKIDYLHSAPTQLLSPKLWSPFVLIGKFEPLGHSSALSWIWPFVISLIILLILGLWGKRRTAKVNS